MSKALSDSYFISHMDTTQLTYRIAFASIRGMGYELAEKLLDVVGSEQNFFELSEDKLRAITGSRSRIYSSSYRNEHLAKAQREINFINDNNVRAIYFTDDDYPKRLTNAPDSPILLYACGPCDLNSAHIISMVGTRHATAQGIRFCETLISEFAQQLPGTVVVSGLAYGIDIASHRAAIKHNLPTVAVMARGLNKIYPDAHRTDAANIVRHGGAIVTDYMSQDAMHKGNFLARNRIIAALADCTVVVESALNGGALVTARLAASYDRDVFAVPGKPGDEYSRGCNRLIQNNQAMLITCADDIIKAMNWECHKPAAIPREMELFPSLSPEEKAVVDYLKTNGESHINVIAQALQAPVYRIMSTLVDLDCRGLVVASPGSRYSLP